MTVRDIVRNYLISHGYSGLAECDTPDGCGCRLDDLMPCDSPCDNCEPAYLVPCDCEDGGEDCGAKDYHGDGRHLSLHP
jgi:hypothetical protein